MVRIVSEYDQEIPQSQTADNPVTPRGRAVQEVITSHRSTFCSVDTSCDLFIIYIDKLRAY